MSATRALAPSSVLVTLLAAGAAVAVGSVAHGQRVLDEADLLSSFVDVGAPGSVATPIESGGPLVEDLSPYPNVVVTGYWPPTNEMLRRFSADPSKNPDGWIGANWEGRGYDVYAYFPEFTPPGCSSCGRGFGDLEVDYQDTSADFWPIVDGLEPVAVVTFSRGANNLSWEVEMNQYNRTTWINDYVAPLQPTPAPPDPDYPPVGLRLSMLPVDAIVEAIGDAGLGLDPFICYTGSGGGFLSEFIAYHGVWYQALHADPQHLDYCAAAGHVHVGGQISWPVATEAAKVTIRTVMDHVDGLLPVPGDIDRDGDVDVQDLLAVLAAWGECPVGEDCPADIDQNGTVDINDLLTVLGNWGP